MLNVFFGRLDFLPDWISYLLYFCILLLLTGISLRLADKFKDENIEAGGILHVDQANNSFMPSYLGYFFVAVSVNSNTLFVAVYLIIFLFTFLSQTHYYNPLFLVFNYRFYFLTTNRGNRIFVITRKKLEYAATVAFDHLKRINNFTFIDKSK